MARIFRFVFIMLCGLLLLPTLAQDDDTTETYEFPDSSATITFMSTLELTEADEGHIELTSDNVMVKAYDSVALETTFEFTTADTLEDALTALVPQLIDDSVEINEDNMSVDDNHARYVIEVDDDTMIIIVVMMTDETFGLLQFTSPTDDLTESEAMLDDILASFNTAGGGLLGALGVSDVVCNVSTADANTVQVRVGPGINRTVVSFLPADTEFAVQGKTESDDESLWFKLDKDEAAPGKSVNETWILADDVDQEGDCDAIGDALAPPIIPITVQTASDGSDTATEPIIPTLGTWRITIIDVSSSCAEDESLLTFLESVEQTISLTGNDTTGLIIDELTYPAIAPNTYSVSSSFPVDTGTVSLGITVTVTSETSMTGALSYNLPNCQESASLRVTYP